jgi:hypothetical protein
VPRFRWCLALCLPAATAATWKVTAETWQLCLRLRRHAPQRRLVAR